MNLDDDKTTPWPRVPTDILAAAQTTAAPVPPLLAPTTCYFRAAPAELESPPAASRRSGSWSAPVLTFALAALLGGLCGAAAACVMPHGPFAQAGAATPSP